MQIMFLRTGGFEICKKKKKTLKDYTLDSQESKLICGNSVIHEASEETLWSCVTPAVVLTCLLKTAAIPAFLGPTVCSFFKTFIYPRII